MLKRRLNSFPQEDLLGRASHSAPVMMMVMVMMIMMMVVVVVVAVVVVHAACMLHACGR